MAKSQNYSFDDLVRWKIIPENTELLTKEQIKRETVVYTDENSLKNVGENIGVIADGSVWVGKSENKYFSYDGNFLWISNNLLSKNKIDKIDGVMRRIPLSTTVINKEENRMENKTSANDLLNAVEGIDATAVVEGENVTPAAEEVKPSAAFTSDEKELKKLQKQQRKEQYDRLLAETDKIQLRDRTALTNFNRTFGSLIGYVVNNEPKVSATTVKKFALDSNGNRLHSSSASNEEIGLIKAKKYKGVSSKAFEKVDNLVIKQQGTGSPKGLILSLPKGGAVLRDELVSNETTTPVKFDENNKDLAILVFPLDTAISYIADYFGGEIKENEATHGDSAGTVVVKGKCVVKDGAMGTIYKLVPSNRKKLIDVNNFLPRKTYKTMALSEIRSSDAKVKSNANRSLFGNLIANSEKYNAMPTDVKSQFAEKDGVYTSDFIDNNKNPNVLDFFTKEPIANPAIPVKEPKGKEGKEKLAYVTFDVLNPNKELESINPQVNPRYQAIVGALGGLTVKDVVAKAISVKKKSKNSMEISSEDMIKLLTMASQGHQIVDSNLVINTDTNKAIVDALSTIKYSK